MWWRQTSERRARRWAWVKRDNVPRSILRFSSRATGRAWQRRLAPAALALFSVSVGIILIWAGIRSLGQLLFRQNELFRIRDIKIECSGDIIMPRHIMDYAELSEMKYLFGANIARLREQLLLKVPRLKEVEIRRRLPGELLLRVRERAALANLAVNSYYLALDREGYVLGPAPASKTMPVLAGYALPGIRPGVQLNSPGIRNALEVLDVCQSTPIGLRVRIASIDVREESALVLHLANGARARLAWNHMGESSALEREHLEQKLARLAENLKSAAARNKRISWIDMTFDNNFPAQLY